MRKQIENDRGKDLATARKIASGDREAFGEFVDRYGPRVQAMARRYALSFADAEDLTQDVFVDLYRCIASFNGSAALSTWTYKVALNHCMKHRERRPAATAELIDESVETRQGEGADPSTSAVRSELKRTVDRALDHLSQDHRDVVVLHELHELTYSECASILHVPIGTVKSRLHHAFVALRGVLAAYVRDEPLTGDVIRATAETIG